MTPPCPRLLVLLLALGLAPAARAEPVVTNAVLVVVNGEAITTVQVRRRAAPALRVLRRWPGPAWKRAEAMREALAAALEAAVEGALFEQAAREASIVVDDREVESVIEQMAAEARLKRPQYVAQLWESGYDEAALRRYVRWGRAEQRVLRAAATRDPEAYPPGAPEAWRKTWLDARKRQAVIERPRPR